MDLYEKYLQLATKLRISDDNLAQWVEDKVCRERELEEKEKERQEKKEEKEREEREKQKVRELEEREK